MSKRRLQFGSAVAALLVLVLSGCGDPIDKMPRLSQVPLADGAPQADALAAPTDLEPQAPEEGLFARLLRKREAAPQESAMAAPQTGRDGASAAAPMGLEAGQSAQEGLGAAPAPAAAAATAKSGFFGRLIGRGKSQESGTDSARSQAEAPAADPVIAALPDAPQADARAKALDRAPIAADPIAKARDPEKRGLFSRLGMGRKKTAAADPVEAALAEAASQAPAAQASEAPVMTALAPAADAPAPAKPAAEASASAKPERKGLRNLLRGNKAAKAEKSAEAQATLAAMPAAKPNLTPDAAPEKSASAATGAEPTPPAAPTKKRRGLFASSKAAKSPTGPDATPVAYGTQLPYGQIAHLCQLPTSAMGKQVASYPERGAKYRLYDSLPGNTGPHTFYITGFDDGCTRQFTAALAVFGTASMYERLQYLLPAKQRSNGTADRAYEKVKSKVCGVSKGKPCGAKITRLEKDTVFLSVYERYGDNARWTNLLLHDGAVMASDMKAP